MNLRPEEISAVLSTVRESLQVGDLLAYRHGKTSDTSGHVYIYMGNEQFLHCYGGGSYTRNESNPALSYDSNASETTAGQIDYISADSIFTDTSHKRYLFKATSSDTVRNFCLLRPFARGLTPTEETLGRMKIAGLSMEKVSSVFENTSVKTGDVITYKITLKNTNSAEVSGVELTDTIPGGTEFVSASDGVTVSGDTVSWSGSVPGKSTVTVTIDVKVTAAEPGTLIKSEKTFVNGVKLGNIVHALTDYSKINELMLKEKANEYATKEKAFETGTAMANSLYKEALGIEVFEELTESGVLDLVIDNENKASRTDTELSEIIAPNLYGGHIIRAGWVYQPEQNDRTRLISKEELMIGDIIVADWSGGSITFVYAGNSKLLTVENGTCQMRTIGNNIYGSTADNILISLLAYDRFAILRPSMADVEPTIDVQGISVTQMPSKLEYVSGETFDATGMKVVAHLSDNSVCELSEYTVSPKILVYPENTVTVSFGELSSTINVNVGRGDLIDSVSEVLQSSVGSSVRVEGIVAGVAHEGLKNDTEMLLKDTSTDEIIAVRNIPYGTFPNFGYEKGDRIIFDATVKKDTSTSTCYSLKKYLEFSSSNGTIESTIISSGNKLNYSFNNAIAVNSWEDMLKYIVKNELEPYTYFKFSPGSYVHFYAGSDTDNYRLHKNAAATIPSEITLTAGQVAFRNDVMSANLGSDWSTLLFDELADGYPGTYIENGFYVLYAGGNKSYFQFVILERDWIYESLEGFEITGVGADGKSADVKIPRAGEYTVIFAKFDGNKFEKSDIVPVTVEKTATGDVNVKMSEEFELDKDDKIMLWNNTINTRPMCDAFIVE